MNIQYIYIYYITLITPAKSVHHSWNCSPKVVPSEFVEATLGFAEAEKRLGRKRWELGGISPEFGRNETNKFGGNPWTFI
jgi:hypothetical protein